MDKQEAAEILIEMAEREHDPETAEALKMGAESLHSYHWVEGDLKDWLES